MVEYKCVLIAHGVQYVIIIGMKRMLVLYVDNLDMHQKVESNFFNTLKTIFLMIIIIGASARTMVFTETTWPIHIVDLNCNGHEDSILDCSYNELLNDMCNEDDDAAVICQCNINYYRIKQ